MLSMARAMSASDDLKPNATRVMRRIFGVDRLDAAIGQAVLNGGEIETLCLTMRRCRSTKVGMRQRRAPPIPPPGAPTAPWGLSRETNRGPSLGREGPGGGGW